MTKFQAEIIMAYAESNMKPKAAGKKLYMSGEAVCYHIAKIQKQMGFNPRKFFDLCYLVGIAAQRLGGNHE